MASWNREQTPSKAWYGWQKMVGLTKAFADKSYGKDAKVMGVNAATTAGLLAGAYALASVSAFLFFLPAAAALGGAGYFGYKTWQKASLLSTSPVVVKHVRKAEQQWADVKALPTLLARAAAFSKRTFGRGALALTTTLKWAGYTGALGAVAAAGAVGLQVAGYQVLPAVATQAVTAAVGHVAVAAGVSAAVATYGLIGLAALAVPVCLGVGMAARGMSRKLKEGALNAQAETRLRPVVKSRMSAAANANAPSVSTVQPASVDFEQAVKPAAQEQLTPEQKRSAEARAARRRNARR